VPDDPSAMRSAARAAQVGPIGSSRRGSASAWCRFRAGPRRGRMGASRAWPAPTAGTAGGPSIPTRSGLRRRATVMTRQLTRSSRLSLRALELDENTERADLNDFETSKERKVPDGPGGGRRHSGGGGGAGPGGYDSSPSSTASTTWGIRWERRVTCVNRSRQAGHGCRWSCSPMTGWRTTSIRSGGSTTRRRPCSARRRRSARRSGAPSAPKRGRRDCARGLTDEGRWEPFCEAMVAGRTGTTWPEGQA
jgi:hypothetical protein